MSIQFATASDDPLGLQLGYLHGILEGQTGDLTQEESLFQPPGGANCVNWIVGHVVATRHQMLQIVGRPSPIGDDIRQRYARGGEPITGPGEGVQELSRLLAVYDETQAPILEGLEAMSAEDRVARVSWFGGEVSKRGALGGLLFHEAYHAGQTGLIRRLLGKPSAVGA